MRQDGDAVAVILEHGSERPPGTTSACSNPSAHLVGAVLAEALRPADGSDPRPSSTTRPRRSFRPVRPAGLPAFGQPYLDHGQ